MAGAPAEEQTTVCQRIYTPINARAAKVKSSRCISRYIKKKKKTNTVKHPFCISDSSRRFSPSFFVPIHILLFFFPLLSSFPPLSPLLLSLLLLPPLLSPPVVVMPTSQETVLSWIRSGRADQLMSGVVQACAQIAPPVCAPCSQRGLFVIPRGARLPRVLSRLVFSFFFLSFIHPLIPSFQSVSSQPTTTHGCSVIMFKEKWGTCATICFRDVCWL